MHSTFHSTVWMIGWQKWYWVWNHLKSQWWNLFQSGSAQLSSFQTFFDQSRRHSVEFTFELYLLIISKWYWCRTNMAFSNQLCFNKCSIFHTGMLKFKFPSFASRPGSSNQAYFNQSLLHWKSAPLKGHREHTAAEVGLSELRHIRLPFIRGCAIWRAWNIQ